MKGREERERSYVRRGQWGKTLRSDQMFCNAASLTPNHVEDYRRTTRPGNKERKAPGVKERVNRTQ